MIIAADPGSRQFGWASFDLTRTHGRGGWRRALVSSGTWRLWSQRDKKRGHPGLRWQRLRERLDEVAELIRLDGVVYELVHRHDGTVAAHRYGGAEAILLGWASAHGIPVTTVEVAEVKTAALGEGVGTKKAVEAAVRRLFPGVDFDGPDAIDATAAGLAHLQKLGLAPATPRPVKLYTAARWRTAKCHRLSSHGRSGDCHFCELPLCVGTTYATLGKARAHYDCTPGLGAAADRWIGTGKLLESEAA